MPCPKTNGAAAPALFTRPCLKTFPTSRPIRSMPVARRLWWTRPEPSTSRWRACRTKSFSPTRSPRKPTRSGPRKSGLSKTAAARRVDFKHVTGLHLGLADVRQHLDLAAGPHHQVAADLTRLAARHAESAVLASVRQNAGGHGLQKFHAPHAAIAARPAPGAARALADLVTLKAHGKAELQHFGVGQARIGHVGLHHAGAVKTFTGAGAARDGFVILIARIAEGEVVHRALAGRHHPQGAIQRVGDTARRFHVARHHRRWRIRVEHGARRN